MITTLHVVRHGQTLDNAAGRIQGNSESELSALGQQQAQAVARASALRRLAAIYCSDLSRAQATARPLAAQCGLPMRLDRRLRERHYGELEGLTWPEVGQRFPEAYAALSEGQASFRIAGGESRQDLLDRIVPTFDEIVGRHPGQQVAVVTHGGVLGALLTHVLGIDPTRHLAVRTLNGAVSTFEVMAGRYKLITWGATEHLGELISPRPVAGTQSTA